VIPLRSALLSAVALRSSWPAYGRPGSDKDEPMLSAHAKSPRGVNLGGFRLGAASGGEWLGGGRLAGQARSIACRASCGCVLFGLTAIAAVRLPYLAMAGRGALHPPGLSTDHCAEIFWWWQAAQSRREDRVQSEGGHRPAVAGATERERGAGTPERWFGSGPVRLTGGSLESPGAGFSSRCRAMGHRSSFRRVAGNPRGAGFGTGPNVRAGRSV